MLDSNQSEKGNYNSKLVYFNKILKSFGSSCIWKLFPQLWTHPNWNFWKLKQKCSLNWNKKKISTTLNIKNIPSNEAKKKFPQLNLSAWWGMRDDKAWLWWCRIGMMWDERWWGMRMMRHDEDQRNAFRRLLNSPMMLRGASPSED